ncbi:MAG TPA: sensor domain-containing diguanylate cyclase [Gaiellaceae bacterium]|nr:sensor domain-containing diguanylate cyclase [Gaiellaceae bacterium]
MRPLRPAVLLPVVAVDLAIALLRQAQGGTRSGYASLLVLPAVWVAFVAGRRGVALVVATTTLTLAVPILAFGPPDYPGSAWRGAVLLTIVTAIVGLVTERGAAAARQRAVEALRHARTLDRVLRTQTAIALSDPGLDDVLATVVDKALELTNADGAVVELPEGEEMVYRAVAGTAEPFAGLRLPVAGSVSGLCLAQIEPLVVVDAEHDPRVNAETCRRVGARSLVVVPLVHAGEAAGVLKVYSATRAAVGDDEARVLALLGNVIGTGLARAELHDTLAEHAHTDALTGLANRRSWDDQLGRSLAHAARSHETVSVAVCDVDRLKQVNDREGHAAGDALIRDVARCLSEGARAADLLARVGGDEFALLLPGADRDAAAEVLDRLMARLPPGRSVSVGIAEWDGRESGAELVSRADTRMYEQKRRSRAAALR